MEKPSQTNTAYLLDLAGSIRANSITVNTSGADFVFAPDYKLQPLSTLCNYITANRHLPGIAPAKDMQTNGMDLAESETKLLQKVEELTLYLIDKDKQLHVQEKELSLANTRIRKLEVAVQKMELRNENINGKTSTIHKKVIDHI